MANIDAQINDRMATYAGNPQGLMQRYSQTQEIVDLLALQQMKNDRAAATNAIQSAMQPKTNTYKGQLEQEAMQGARNEVMRSMAPGIQQQGQRMAQMQPGGLPTQAAPNMNRMAQGGIVGYAGPNGSLVEGKPTPTLGAVPPSAVGDEQIKKFASYYQTLQAGLAAATTPEDKAQSQQQIQALIRDMGNQHGKVMQYLDSTKGFTTPSSQMAQGGDVRRFQGEEGSYVGANNPLNLRDYNQNWEGETGATDGFVDFENQYSGVRAADKLLSNYGTREGIDTLRGAIARFAPPNENLTEDYISFVSERTGIPSEQPIDLADEGTRRNILTAMAKMESGEDIDVVDVLANDESRFNVTTDSGLSPEEAIATDMQRQEDMTVDQFMESIGKGTPTAAERAQFEGTGMNPYALRDTGAGILNALSSAGEVLASQFGSVGRRRAQQETRRAELATEYPNLSKSQINYLLQGEIGKGQIRPQKEADVPGIPSVLNDMPQPSDAQKFANSFPGAQSAVDQYAEEKDSSGEQQPKGGLDIDFRALREFLAGGAGQTSTAGALAGGARGLGAFQAAEQGRLDAVNKAAAELQLRRDLAENESKMLDRKLLAEYEIKLTTEQLKIAQDILAQLDDPLSTSGREYQSKAEAIREKYKRTPEAMTEALRRLKDGYVQQGVKTVQRGAGFDSTPSTGTQIAGLASRISE